MTIKMIHRVFVFFQYMYYILCNTYYVLMWSPHCRQRVKLVKNKMYSKYSYTQLEGR